MNIDTETGEILEENLDTALSWLGEYTQAMRDMELFKAEHSAIIAKYFELEREITATENELKTRARIEGPVENDSFTVSVVTPMTRWYDADIILEKAPYVRDLPGVLVTSVDKKKIEMLAKGGMIPEAIAAEAYREEAGTPRVTIKVKTA